MKQTRYTTHQIIQLLQGYNSDKKTSDLCREYGIARPTLYCWKQKKPNSGAMDLKEIETLQEENRRLRRMCVDLMFMPN